VEEFLPLFVRAQDVSLFSTEEAEQRYPAHPTYRLQRRFQKVGDHQQSQ
jgi:hypothetical protein